LSDRHPVEWDSRGKTFTDGAPLQVWDCVGDWNQRFTIS